MIPLFVAVALCLLVPWLPVLMYRRLPRRPPPPLSPEQLQRLAAQLRHQRPAEFVEGGAAEDGAVTTDVDPATGPGPAARGASADEPEDEGALSPGEAGASAAAGPLPRLSLGSYRWLNALMAPVIIVTFLALAIGWGLLFQVLGEQRARSLAPAVFVFTPLYGVVCAVPALFLGIFSSLPVLMLPVRLLLGRRRFTEYLFWDEGRLGPGYADGVIRLLTGMALVLGVGSAVFVGVVLNWYTRFGEDEIAIKRPLALREEVHPYGDVEQIVVGSRRLQGNEVAARDDVGLRFRDGRTWSTEQRCGPPPEPGERERLLAFLRQKTGKPVTRVRFLREVIPDALGL
jgi:hypothetical protein